MLRSLTSSIINVVKCHNPNSIRIEQKLFRPVICPIFFILLFFNINKRKTEKGKRNRKNYYSLPESTNER